MDREEIGCSIWILVIALFFYCWHLRSELKDAKSDLSYTEVRLFEANQKIDSLNSQIEWAQRSLGDGYEAMYDALNDLYRE